MNRLLNFQRTGVLCCSGLPTPYCLALKSHQGGSRGLFEFWFINSGQNQQNNRPIQEPYCSRKAQEIPVFSRNRLYIKSIHKWLSTAVDFSAIMKHLFLSEERRSKRYQGQGGAKDIASPQTHGFKPSLPSPFHTPCRTRKTWRYFCESSGSCLLKTHEAPSKLTISYIRLESLQTPCENRSSLFGINSDYRGGAYETYHNGTGSRYATGCFCLNIMG